MITPMMPGNASAAFMPNLPSSDAKVSSLFLRFPACFFCSFFVFGQRFTSCHSPPTTRKQDFNQNTDSHSNSHEYGSNHNALLPCSANEVSLSNTLAIVSLKLVIWLLNFPLKMLMLSCLTDRSSFRSAVLHLMLSQMPPSYSGFSKISLSLHFSHSMHCCNSAFFTTSTFSNP